MTHHERELLLLIARKISMVSKEKDLIMQMIDRVETATPELNVGPFVIQRADPDYISIMNHGEGGWFKEVELAEVIGRFVSERL